jgi:hypothetical protein
MNQSNSEKNNMEPQGIIIEKDLYALIVIKLGIEKIDAFRTQKVMIIERKLEIIIIITETIEIIIIDQQVVMNMLKIIEKTIKVEIIQKETIVEIIKAEIITKAQLHVINVKKKVIRVINVINELYIESFINHRHFLIM